MEQTQFKAVKSKYQVAELLGISRTTLDYYLNKRYFVELQKIGYRKRQKHLNPKQLNYLADKIGLSE
jgi:predicted transcriptional regulator